MILIVIFLFALLTYVTLALRSGSAQVTGSRLRFDREQARALAEAGVQKARACLATPDAAASCGGASGYAYAGETFTLAGGSVTVEASGTGDERSVTSDGTANGSAYRIRTRLKNFSEVRFVQAMSGGGHGATLRNNAQIIGDVYMGGSVLCGGGASLTGSATLAGTAVLDGCTVHGSVYAHEIRNSAVDGDAYYQTISGSTVGGRLFPGSADPPPPPPSITDDQVAIWQDGAAQGTVIDGDRVLTGITAIGPALVKGDLTITNNADVTLQGIIYVEGSVHFGNNAKLRLDPSFGDRSGVLLTGGPLVISNNASFYGSGSPKSLILVISLDPSLDPAAPAILLDNNVENAVFFTKAGLMRISNNVTINGAVAEHALLDENAAISYLPVMSDVGLYGGAAVPGFGWEEAAGTRSE